MNWRLYNQLESFNSKIIYYKPNDHFVFSYWDEPGMVFDRYFIKVSKPESLDDTFTPVPEYSSFLKISHYPISLVKAFDNHLKEKLMCSDIDFQSSTKCSNEKILREWLSKEHTIYRGKNLYDTNTIEDWALPRYIDSAAYALSPNTHTSSWVNQIVRMRAFHKIFLLSSFFQIFGSLEWDIQIWDEAYTLPYLKVTSRVEHIKDAILFAIKRSNGLITIDIPNHPDINGDLIPFLQNKLNFYFHRYINSLLPIQQELEKQKSIVTLNDLLGMVGTTLKTFRIYLLTISYIHSIQHLSSYININNNNFYHNNDPLLNSYNYFIANLQNADNLKTLTLLIISFSKFKFYHLVYLLVNAVDSVLLLESASASAQFLKISYLFVSFFLNLKIRLRTVLTMIIKYVENEDGYEIILYLAFYPRYSMSLQQVNAKENSILEIHRGKQEWHQDRKGVPYEEYSLPLLSHFVTKFESLIPISEIARALQSTQEKNKFKNFYDLNMARIKHSQIIRIERDSFASDNPKCKDLSFEYGLVLNFECKNEKYAHLLQSSPVDNEHTICYLNSFHISKAIFTIQGKYSRFWFVTVHLSSKNEMNTKDVYVKENVYLQYFNIPYTKYYDVAESFFRDIKNIISLGASDRIVSLPPPPVSASEDDNRGDNITASLTNNTFGKIIKMLNIIQYNYKRIILSYDSDTEISYCVQIQAQEAAECLQLSFFTTTFFTANMFVGKEMVPKRNPHALIKDTLEHEFNKHKNDLQALMQLLNVTRPLLEVLTNLDDVPYMDIIDKSTLEASLYQNKDFTYNALGIRAHLITFKKYFAILFTMNPTDSTISLRDYSNSDNNYYRLINLKKFVESYTTTQSSSSSLHQESKIETLPGCSKSQLENLTEQSQTISLATFKSLFGSQQDKTSSFFPFQLYCRALYIMKCTFDILNSEDNVILFQPKCFADLGNDWKGANVVPLIFQFSVSTLRCQIDWDDQRNYESLLFTVLDPLTPTQGPPSYVIHPKDYNILTSFFAKKVLKSRNIYSNLLAFYRILNAPPNLLRDCLEIMRIELLSGDGQALPSQSMPNPYRWFLNWILTIPPTGPLLAPVGSPSVIIKNKMLFLIGLRSNPELTLSHLNQSITIPLVYDLNLNLTQMADPTKFANFIFNAPLMNSINVIIKRFTDYHCQNFPNHCSIYPAIKDILTNLVLPA